MIKNFANRELEKCWREGHCIKISTHLRNRLLMKLDWLDAAIDLKDLQNPPSNHLHKLSGRYANYWAISINGPWRLIFRFENGDAYDVQLIQYH